MWTPEMALRRLWAILPDGDWAFKTLCRYDLTTCVDWQLTVTLPGKTLTIELREDK